MGDQSTALQKLAALLREHAPEVLKAIAGMEPDECESEIPQALDEPLTKWCDAYLSQKPDTIERTEALVRVWDQGGHEVPDAIRTALDKLSRAHKEFDQWLTLAARNRSGSGGSIH